MPAEIQGPTVDWRERHRETERCELEAHPRAYWRRRVFDNGSIHVEFFCETCERAVTQERYGTRGPWVPNDWFAERVGKDAGVTVDELPLSRRSLRYHLCYLCGATALCEFHHVAPQAIYGTDAERYPVVPLCKTCHDAETDRFKEKLERYVAERIRRFLAKNGGQSA